MPVPTRDKVVELLNEPVRLAGYDLEDVEVTQAGKKSIVRVIVDSDAGLALDAIVTLTRLVSDHLDTEKSFGEAPYTLEVTSPGVSRPLTEPRHWRRARGRKVEAVVTATGAEPETISARIGRVHGEGGETPQVDLVLPSQSAKVGPAVRKVALAEVSNAVVQVEFGKVDPRELELAGGVQAGRESTGTVDLEAAEDAIADSGEAAKENDK
ncbi:ribosome maturation factor RimP [Tomitella biformata]|uniref:ribosome maturation factor RimP n=1 Tax=Tomitella biformata TaxID=630403 RepID=UPI000467B337|nr:ribosome maturation factor RimP [Tomitella biformata]